MTRTTLRHAALRPSLTLLALVALLTLLSLPIACAGSRLTQENYEKITEGMTVEEVERILGEPTEMDSTTLPLLGTATVYTYRAEDGSEATLVFYRDKLKMKSGSLKR